MNGSKNSEYKYQRESGQMTESDGPKNKTFPVKFRNDNLGKHCMKTRSPCFSIPYTEKSASTCPGNHLVMSLQRRKRKIIKELVTV